MAGAVGARRACRSSTRPACSSSRRAIDDYFEQSIAVHRRLGLPIEVLDGAALRRRFPMIDFTGIEAGLYEPALRRADGAARGADPGRRVRPRRRRHIGRRRSRRRRAGGAGCASRRAPPTGETDRAPSASSSPAGPGSAGSFPDLLGRRIFPTRQEVFFFAPRGRRRALTQPGRLPGWADFNGGDIYYGFPDLEGRGFKIAHDAHGPPIDPDTRRPHPLGRRRWPTCAPSWPAASRASPTARSARRGSANMRTARTATS